MGKVKPNILIIYTGGTIGMIEDDVTGTLRPFDFDHLIENVPKINKLGYDINHLQFDEPIDSSDMDPQCWARIARCIADNYAVCFMAPTLWPIPRRPCRSCSVTCTSR